MARRVRKRFYNYRHRRARGVAENVSDIFESRFHIFRKTTFVTEEIAVTVATAALTLTN
jgi:hypothetical protein